MAMSATVLRDAIRAKLVDRGWAEDNAALTEFCADIADAVVSHIVASAVVTVPALGLIAPGGMTPAPVTGAATGSIT